MIRLKADSPLRRETALIVQGRRVIIEAAPRLLTLRQKGRRYSYSIGWESVCNRAVEIKVRRQMEERKRRQGRGRF